MAKQDDDDSFIDLDKEQEDDSLDEDRGDSLEDDEDEELDDKDVEVDDEEVEDEEEEEDEEAPRGKSIKIPKKRFDEVNERYKESKDRLKWLEDQFARLLSTNTPLKEAVEESAQETYDFDEAEEKYISLILEGETKDAAKLRREIDSKRSQENQRQYNKIKQEAAEEIKKSQDDERFNLLIETYESKHAFLNPSSKKYNADAVDTINTLMAGYLAKGELRSSALKKSLDKVVPLFESESPASKSSVDKRTIEQRKKNVAAIKRTPPKTNGKSSRELDVDAIDLSNLSESEFKKLDKRTLAKLRGDVL
jgi:hypothetical protein